MTPWRRVAGALKDRNSIWIVTFRRRSGHRNPDLEPLIIKATSHDDSRLDYKHVQRVYKWLNISPLYLKSFFWGLTMRLQKTRCWVVALKGLILVHGVLCANFPGAHVIGRLPFDLSNFTDAYSDQDKMWGYNAFVRTYFAYLDKRSSFVSYEVMKQGETVMDELERLQKLQGLLDTLLQIKPQIETMRVRNILIEAMDPVLLDIFHVYSTFCDGMAKALVRIYEEGGKLEASLGLKVLQKAVSQSDELSDHLEFCRDIGILTASQCPRVERIPEEDVLELKRIINGVPRKQSNIVNRDHDHQNGTIENNGKAIVVRHTMDIVEKKEVNRGLITVVTDKWEVFDDDIARDTIGNPFATTISLMPQWHSYNHALPDLISF